MDYRSFVSERKALLVSPAGYGKTYTIVQSLKYTQGKQLILTHTHAGVASIREKIENENIPSNQFHIETISSFCQKYVQNFYVGNDIPDQENKQYHAFTLDKAFLLFKSPMVQHIVKSTFVGLFVDEYQDCTKKQHDVIMVLSDLFPTRILGDPLQSIFDFNGDLVDFERDLPDFTSYPDLDVPNRWYRNGYNTLGDIIKGFRENLISREPVSLIENIPSGLHIFPVQNGDLYSFKSSYTKPLQAIIANRRKDPTMESLLIIVPEYEEVLPVGSRNRGTISDRVNIKNRIDFANRLTLLEAIDDRSFYQIARTADELVLGINRAKNKINRVKKDILLSVFKKTEIDSWFSKEDFTVKRSESDKGKTFKVKQKFNSFFKEPSTYNLLALLVEAKSQFGLKQKREAIHRNLLNSLKQSTYENISVYEAMKNNRNQIKRVGRKVDGKCIGTTLLTKGLEFDTVVLLDANKFDTPEHLYVALSRCCKKLIIFTDNLKLSPY
ncbi:UvrD-helicase domain-containing protein [Sphingobacterium bambusae]|uniref:DNA 3'-5' helicase II n=1 Tax=Sphingobacterium bambusae TaxID=662858 RepID=A0ABW6BEH8_9SPHI|nr:UvrD-helicase domain-containing protein [Sphingobacterium bambusae]WPL48537.1 UvrD-helicase domain-containing protein [Sphingobacterium bambusae]